MPSPNQKLKTWTCICGRVHPIDDKPIYCAGPGHERWISPKYWTYRNGQPEEDEKRSGQLKMF